VTGARRIFSAAGLPEKAVSNIVWRNVTAQGQEAGTIEYARNWKMENVRLRTPTGAPVRITNSTQVAAPAVATQ
jgi:hypothetical protein